MFLTQTRRSPVVERVARGGRYQLTPKAAYGTARETRDEQIRTLVDLDSRSYENGGPGRSWSATPTADGQASSRAEIRTARSHRACDNARTMRYAQRITEQCSRPRQAGDGSPLTQR